jgi:hypothetical protein
MRRAVTLAGGRGQVTLEAADFKGAGGEGEVYVKAGRAYKLYKDPKGVIPAGKVTELEAIRDARVLCPEALLLEAGNVVGYCMPALPPAYTLCEAIPPAFRQREGLGFDRIGQLVLAMRAGFEAVHAASTLVVDANENNFAIGKDFAEVYFIDVDSYQTPSYPANFIADNIRDRHMRHPRAFDVGTDWFSFAVLTFRFWTGLHPYLGLHPTLRTLDERMRAGVSTLDPSVRTPKVSYLPTVIPEGWRRWYGAVLGSQRLREAPPVDFSGAVAAPTVAVRALATGQKVVIQQVLPGPVVDYGEVNNVGCAWDRPGGVVGFDASGGVAVGAWIDQGRVRLVDIGAGREVTALDTPHADEVCSVDGRVYLLYAGMISELVISSVRGGKAVGNPRLCRKALPLSTRLFPGMAVENMLGSSFLSLFPKSGHAYTCRVPELDGKPVVTAKAHHNVAVVVVTAAGGGMDRFVFRFDSTFSGYDVEVVPDVPIATANFVVLASGTCALINEREELELFMRTGAKRTRVVADSAIGLDMNLTTVRGRAGFVRPDGVYSLTLASS